MKIEDNNQETFTEEEDQDVFVTMKDWQLYFRIKLFIITGIVIGVILTLVLTPLINLAVGHEKIAESSITIIFDESKAVKVKKGFRVCGNAAQLFEGDDPYSEKLETPFVTTKAMLIVTDSICVVYKADDWGSDGVNEKYESYVNSIIN